MDQYGILVNINSMTGQCNKTNQYNAMSQYNRTKIILIKQVSSDEFDFKC
jgi:hypothetical protein